MRPAGVAALALVVAIAAAVATVQPTSAQPGPTPTFISELGPASVVTPTQPEPADTPVSPAATETPVATASPIATSEVQGVEQPGDDSDGIGVLQTSLIVAGGIAAMFGIGAFFAVRTGRN